MLVKFKVKNFKSFKDEFILDLTKTKNYEFSKNAIHSHIASKAMIYGENGCGKSNLTLAIFDIVNHLKDEETPKDYSENYLNAESTSDIAEFEYHFKFQEDNIVYKYTKRSSNIIVLEILTVNGVEVLSIDRDKSSEAKVILKGTETLKNNLESSNVSWLKYVMNNSLLTNDATNSAIRTMMKYLFC
jgi:AAA15 family ATPase/GTPase